MHPPTNEQNQARRWNSSFHLPAILITPLAFAASAFGQQVAPAAADAALEDEPIQMLEFFVQEAGISRATNSITAADAKVALPGMSVEKLLGLVPGVNIRSTDPFGFYEFGNDIRVRSFGISALAVTVDDVPMGNNSPRYGTPAGRIVDGENLSAISVSQGTGDVTSPAYEALGGSIKYYTASPSQEMGALFKLSVGDFNMRRWFMKAETGEILPGLTAYVSSSQLTFNAAGIPKESEGRKVEGKIRYVTDRATFNFAYTWNDRDDYDTRSVQWNRWKALETGDPYGGYSADWYGTGRAYSAAEVTNVALFAANGYATYLPTTLPALAANAGLPASAALTASLQGNYSDGARRFGALDYVDPAVALGDGLYGQYYKYWRNGRMDSLFRGSVDLRAADEIELRGSAYYHDRHNYGTFPVLRSDARAQIVNAYSPSNNTTGQVRTDIWPRWAYRDSAGNLVPYGTPGAVPVGYNDANNNGFFDVGETLNTSATPAALSNAHALIAPTSTTIANATPGIPGATARDEDFGGERFGFNLKGTWTKGVNKLTVGGWFENDEQMAYRPTYNLSGGSIEGGFLYDQVLFNNYTQNFSTEATLFYVEDSLKLMEDRLTVTLAAKSLTVDKKANGILFTQAWWRPIGQQTVKREATYEDNFLPQIGLGYNLRPGVELFANYAENLASPANNVIANVDFDPSLRPEKAENYDAGVRFSSGRFGASLAVFYNKYEDRILSVALTEEELIARNLRGVTGATSFRNVGGIDSTGAEFSYDWRTPISGLRLTGAFAYQKSEFSEDLLVTYSSFHANSADPRSAFYVPIPNPNYVPGSTDPTQAQFVRSWELQKGKSQGNTPEFTANANLTYSWRFIELNFGGQFYDSVYVNTLNTERIPSWTNFDAGITVRGPKGSKLDGFSAQLTVVNLFDDYIWRASSYTGSFNGSVTPDYGRNVVLTVEARF
jgi:iron complex outermembrane recepter protein